MHNGNFILRSPMKEPFYNRTETVELQYSKTKHCQEKQEHSMNKQVLQIARRVQSTNMADL